jgi:hypothetical protein
MILLKIDYFLIFLEMLKFIIPALIVFGITYTMLSKFLEDDYRGKLMELKKENTGTLVPLKLQAYERLTIFLDRISPDNLVIRLADPKINATQFKHMLIHAINDEFTHNVSQQIYVSTQAWKIIKAVKEQVIQTIENCYKDMSESSKSTDLGKAILQDMMFKKEIPTHTALEFIKREVELVF